METHPLVLVASGDPFRRHALLQACRRLGATAAGFPSSDRLLAVLRSVRPRVIVADVDLHPVGAHELSRFLAADPALERVPVVLVAGTGCQSPSAPDRPQLAWPFEPGAAHVLLAEVLASA
jgi:CheY-like chemotaxis protein